ncbi:hypothetical protein BO94DRAFT_587775 [Aspergillus sclerotioniger CBS 115572]|uniref:Uncharacterized protein n=1 Tax=Aspergillus sclerotioniger CBS 115572 TaxID=1450535 RepID=A0A317W848_9EURO|nr:hypothetical protein BO94DRAFT_587775 [Aspergillus sclerotioniger CBS 115572]PWY80320.1 hypothetical protein BO94DRAFT_587775 [Aspergillus sclerotioniger CBS 115572]
MAEWHRQVLDQDNYSDDDLAFIGSDLFTPFNLSSPGSFCSSGPGFPSQGSSQAGQDREGSPSGASSLFNEPVISLPVVVQGQVRATGTTGSLGTQGSRLASSAIASGTNAKTFYESQWATRNDQTSWKECSSQPVSRLSEERGVEWPQRHSLAGQPFITANVLSKLPEDFFWKNVGKDLSVSPHHLIPRPLHLHALEPNREALLIGSGLTTSPLLIIGTSQVHEERHAAENLRQAYSSTKTQHLGLSSNLDLEIRLWSTCISPIAQDTLSVRISSRTFLNTKATLELVEMAGGANKLAKKTRGQRTSPSSLGSATVHHHGPVEGSGTDVGRLSAAAATHLQDGARPRSTEADEINPTRRSSGEVISRGTQTEPVRLLPAQIYEGAVPYQAFNGPRNAPTEPQRFHQRNLYRGNETRRRPTAREAPTISGLLRDIPQMAYVQRGQNASRANAVASIPSVNPPVQGGIGRMAGPHGDNRASVHPRLVEARDFQTYINFMLDEVHDNTEDGFEDIGSILGFPRV